MNYLDVIGEKNERPANHAGEKDLLFSLDIGTSSVVGVVGAQSKNGFEAIDFEQVFHSVNAMRDGQIENIESVSNVVKQVKETLEKRNSVVFTKVAVAAAGRALKTARGFYEHSLDENNPIDAQLVNLLEYSAVSAAQEGFFNSVENMESIEKNDFFCVGYGAIEYKLDGYPLVSLEGHMGNTAHVEVIAAFLPRAVVRSLYTVATMNGLEVDNLTLEPIAAINVIVPRDVRLLNIAIVDIGAGTSDIAISKNGSIIAYGMATVAGDEITEAIMRSFLTDFDTAEHIKIDYSKNQSDISFTDILGNSRKVNFCEIHEVIEASIDSLCEIISDSILRLNETPPVAVFLVGGGSQTPGMCEKIAKRLALPPERVAVGGKQSFKHITLCSEALLSPEFVTPLGIGVVCSLYRGCNFFSIVINGRKIMVLDNKNITVMDALLSAGIRPSRLIGMAARNLIFKLDGMQIVKKGTPSVAGKIIVNGEDATVETPIKQGDVIVTQDGEKGEPPVVRISDIAKDCAFLNVTLDGDDLNIKPLFYVGEKQADDDYIISEGDSLTSSYPKTIKELFERINKKNDDQITFTINGETGHRESPICEGDIICSVTDGGISEKPFDKMLKVCVNGEWHEIEAYSDDPPLFANMLSYSDIDTTKKSGTLVLRLNGDVASYTAIINDGDNVEIFWES